MVRAVDLRAVARTAAAHQGVLSWGDLVARHPRRQVEAALRAGELERVARGRYALPTAPGPLRSALVHGGAVSHETAARLWFLDTLHEVSTTHVTVGQRACGRPARGVRLHWSDLDPAEVRGRVTSPLRTVLDCARTLPFADGLAIADSALRRAVVEPDQLLVAAARLAGPGSARAQRVAVHADGRAANPFESGLRAIVLDLGVVDLVPQLRVRVTGLSGYVDLGDPALRLVVEAEGFEHHGTRAALHRDCRRYTALARAGWAVLRFSWEDVMFHQDWVGDSVREAVALRRAERSERGTRPSGAVRRVPRGSERRARGKVGDGHG